MFAEHLKIGYLRPLAIARLRRPAACVRGRVVSKRYLAAVTAVSFVPFSHSVLCERYAMRMQRELYVCLW